MNESDIRAATLEAARLNYVWHGRDMFKPLPTNVFWCNIPVGGNGIERLPDGRYRVSKWVGAYGSHTERAEIVDECPIPELAEMWDWAESLVEGQKK